jgi:hypothetical protein
MSKRGQKNVKTWAKDRHNMSTSLEQKSALDKASQKFGKSLSKRGQNNINTWAKPRQT